LAAVRRLGLPLITLAVVGTWLLLPFLQSDIAAQDAIPLLVAGELVTEQPEDVYHGEATGLYDLPEPFRAATCEAYDDEQECLSKGVAFISPPLALPVVAALATLETDVGVLVIRMLGAAALVAGFVVLARRLDPGDDDVVPLTLAAALLLLEVSGQVELGQTSPLLFLLCCLPVARLRSTRSEVGVAVLVALAVAFKAFPAVLLIPMVVHRRWRLAGFTAVAVAALGVASVAIGAAGVWGEFIDLSRTVADASADNPFNSATAAVADAIGLPAAVGTLAGVGLAVAFVAVVLARTADEDVWWSATIPVSLLLLPQVWNHYLLTAVAMVTVASLRRTAHPEWWLLGSVAVLAPYSAGGADGVGWQLYGLLYLVGSLAVVGALVRRRSEAAVPVAARPGP
jgi:hypothetical protein